MRAVETSLEKRGGAFSRGAVDENERCSLGRRKTLYPRVNDNRWTQFTQNNNYFIL